MNKKQKNKNKKTKAISAAQYSNFPTHERLLRGDVRVKQNMAVVETPLRIDKLREKKVIDDMQHLWGLQIITLWTLTQRPLLRATRYDPSMVRGYRFDVSHTEVNRMSAEDQFFKTMSLLRARPHGLINKICFEEKGAIDAGKELGLPINSITVYVRDAFDALGDALAEMRRVRKALEEQGAEHAK